MLGLAMEDEAPCDCPIAAVCSRTRGPLREVERPQHAILYLEGEPADHVYLIRQGSVSLHRSSKNGSLGRAQTICHEGTLLGMEGLVSPNYQSSARAETPLLLCMATRDRVESWVGERHAASNIVLETMLRSREQDFLPKASPDGTATQRVAQWILSRQQPDTDRDLPRKVMAEMLGMRPETLSRSLRALADRGYVKVGRYSLSIIDADGLRSTLPG